MAFHAEAHLLFPTRLWGQTTIDGTPAGLTSASRLLADGRRVFENCRGLVILVQYDAKKEAKLRETVDHIVV